MRANRGIRRSRSQSVTIMRSPGNSAGGGSTTFTSAALALFAAMTTPPTAARKVLINNTILALMSAGVWTQLDILYVLAAADSQAARLNWKNPGTFTAVAVNSPTFEVDRGYTGNGTSSRLRTQYTPSSNAVVYQLNDGSLWSWSRTDLASQGRDVGSNAAPLSLIISRNTSDQTIAAVNCTGSIGPANASSVGFFGATRAINTTITAWKNGVSLGSGAVASTSLASQEQWICGANATSFSSRQISAAAWGTALAGEELAFYNALSMYMQAVGAA